MDHVELIIKGSEAYQAGETQQGLEFFEQAHQLNPTCAAAIYYFANALFMTDQDEQAKVTLEPLLALSEQEVNDGCETKHPDIMSYQIDAYYLMFHIMLHLTEDWQQSVKFARLHLEKRKPGIESTWTKKFIKKELSELEKDFQE